MNTSYDFIIIGAGIAGMSLAYSLSISNSSFLIIHSPKKPSASSIASGLINPIAGKRLETVADFDELYKISSAFYSHIAQLQRKENYFESKEILRIFRNEKEKETFHKKYQQDYSSIYVGPSFEQADSLDINGIKTPFGGFITKNAAVFSYQKFLKDAHDHFKANIVEALVDYSTIQHDAESCSIHIHDDTISCKHIVFCDGWHSSYHSLFSNIAFEPAKGEICLIKAPDLQQDYVISNSFAIIPKGNQLFSCSATFAWNDYSESPTEIGKAELISRIDELLSCNWHLIDHKAGIRPTMFDRKPIIGFHPEFNNIAVFGGLGTKGALWAPKLADLTKSLLLAEKPYIPPDISISRWWPNT